MSRRLSLVAWAIWAPVRPVLPQVGHRVVEHIENAERRRRRRQLELVAIGRRPADAEAHAVQADRTTIQIGSIADRRHDGGRGERKTFDVIGGGAGEPDPVSGVGDREQRRRVVDAAGVDHRAGHRIAGDAVVRRTGHEHTVAAACGQPCRRPVEAERHREVSASVIVCPATPLNWTPDGAGLSMKGGWFEPCPPNR